MATRKTKEPLFQEFLQNPYKNYPFWFKGVIHCHSIKSGDAEQSPYALEYAYYERGHHFCCLTDHNDCTGDPDWPGILHIPSGEDGDAKRHHILAIGINKEKAKWHHDKVDSGRDSDQDGLDDRDTGPCGNIQPRIDYLTQVQEAVAVLAHPVDDHGYWGSGFSLDELLTRKNYTGIEIYNAGGPHWSVDWWDQVLTNGKHKKVWGLGGDDCHNVKNNRKSFNRTWVVVNSELGPLQDYMTGQDTDRKKKLLRNHILQNIKDGNFYTVVRSPKINGNSPDYGPVDVGPALKVQTLGSVITVDTDRASDITFIGGPGKVLSRSRNMLGASYVCEGTENYVRAVVRQTRDDGQEYEAYSQPLFTIKKGLTGIVTNEAGTVKVQNAAMTFVREDGKVKRSTSTDLRSVYRILLENGRYTVTVKHPDYREFTTAPGFAIVSKSGGYSTFDVKMKRK